MAVGKSIQSHAAHSPLNLCVKHQERQEFLGPSGIPQTKHGNVYYITVTYPAFVLKMYILKAQCFKFQPPSAGSATSSACRVLGKAHARKAVAEQSENGIKQGFLNLYYCKFSIINLCVYS